MFFHLVWLNIKARLQYGRSFLYEMIASIAGYALEFVAVWIIINQFGTIGGWTFFEILFLHSMGYFVRATASAFLWDPMWVMSYYMKNGQMDKFFVAPRNAFVYLVGRHFIAWALSHVILGAATMAITLFFLPIYWTLLKVLLFICALMGALLIYGSFIVFSGAISFWTFSSDAFLRVLTNSWNVINWPMSFYPRGMQIILTFFIPFALINYYPTIFLLDKRGAGEWIMLGILGVGLLLFGAMYKLWWLGVTRYQGAGS
ncbi:ABC-2 family transporter protein [Paenibacillus sp. M1]|uniref:ABC-2 family transporter protein n=1 Tax=Paenibacillus haidiansis TaxID=1574488 RepID=A0ABU7VSU5_9BACL